MKTYEIIKAREGEYQRYLDDGYEPFSSVAEDSSYYFTDIISHRRLLQPRTTTYVFLRREKGGKDG